jgi:hypothetical protein
MKRHYITKLDYLGSGVFRVVLTCGHVQHITGKVSKLPRVAVCEVCS